MFCISDQSSGALRMIRQEKIFELQIFLVSSVVLTEFLAGIKFPPKSIGLVFDIVFAGRPCFSNGTRC